MRGCQESAGSCARADGMLAICCSCCPSRETVLDDKGNNNLKFSCICQPKAGTVKSVLIWAMRCQVDPLCTPPLPHLWELTQARSRNNHRTMDEMQKVNLFLLPRKLERSPQQHPGRGTRLREARTAELGPCFWTCCFLLYSTGSHRHSFPLCRAGISSMFVPLSPSQACVIQTQMFCLSSTQS